MKSIVKRISLEEEGGKSSEVKFFARLKSIWHQFSCVGWILSLMVEKDDFPFEEVVRERRRKEKQNELMKRGFFWDLKEAFEGNKKIRVQEEGKRKKCTYMKLNYYGTT